MILAVMPLLAALALPALLGASVVPRVPPEPPPAFRGPDLIERPLDRRMAEDPVGTLTSPPEAWCPAGEDFQRWLKQRSPGARAAAPVAGAKALTSGPAITWNNNVIVMEDDGSLLRNDRRPDLEGLSLEFTPQGDDYTARLVPSAYDIDVGTQVLFDQRGYSEAVVDLTTTAFPFGGLSRTRLWVTSNFVAAFADPNAPGPAQLQIGDLIADRTPRVAPLQQGSSLGGWNAFVREAADRVVITWRATDGGGYDVDVQETLFSDGRIVMTWSKLRGVLHGSVVIIDGDDAWWNDRQLGGSVTSPAGDVGVPAPDGPAADIVEVRGMQVGGSEILQLELDLASPLPAATDGTLQYVFEIRDEPGGDVLWAVWFEWEDGRWNWTYAPAEVTPAGFRFNVTRSGLNLIDDDINVTVWAATSWSWQQAVSCDIAWPSAPPTPLMRDFSMIGAAPLRGPLAEAFTIPALDVYAVYNAFMARFGSPVIDGLAIFQNLYTDIIFYAGAYSTVGNAGADGIGSGSSTDPKAPALLHMNAIRYGWVSWDAGIVTVLNHEYGHHWLYFYSIDEAGTVGKPCGDGHPAGWTHTPAAAPVYNPYDASCMGGSTWTDNADGTFTSAPGFASYGYSWHELYLMGLAAPPEVPDWFYLKDSVPGLPGAYWPEANLTVTANRVNVTLQQIVDAIGPRVPDSTASQKDFSVPMVLVVRPGEWVQGDVDETHRICEVWRPQFNVATLTRATVTCDRIGDRPPVVDITNPATDVTITEGTTLDITGIGTDPDEDAVTLTWDFGALAPGANGPGPHPVLFADPGTYVVTLTGVDATGRPADAAATRTITVQCAPPPEMPILRVAKDATSVTLTLDPGAPPADQAVLGSTLVLPPAPVFTEVAAGPLPMRVPMPAEQLVFYKIAGRNLPDCLGPW